jgi:Flp pilus assembly protein TadB
MEKLKIIIISGAILIGLAVFLLIAGNKIKFRSRMVRLKDEVFESKKKKTKSLQDKIIIILGGIVVAFTIFAVTGVYYFAVFGFFTGFIILKFWNNNIELKRRELLSSQFIDVLGQLESAIYGGLNPYQALEDSVPNMSSPAKDIFYEILRRVRTGDTLVQAIETIRRVYNWEDLKILSIGVGLYNRVGCDLGEICRMAMDNHEEKESFKSVIEASVAQNMMTLKVLTVLPFLFIGLARVMAPGFAWPLFHTLEGVFVFIIASMWILLGNFFSLRMIRSTLGQGS